MARRRDSALVQFESLLAAEVGKEVASQVAEKFFDAARAYRSESRTLARSRRAGREVREASLRVAQRSRTFARHLRQQAGNVGDSVSFLRAAGKEGAYVRDVAACGHAASMLRAAAIVEELANEADQFASQPRPEDEPGRRLMLAGFVGLGLAAAGVQLTKGRTGKFAAVLLDVYDAAGIRAKGDWTDKAIFPDLKRVVDDHRLWKEAGISPRSSGTTAQRKT